MNKGDAQICFSYAALAQKLEITSLQVLNFQQKINIKQLPVTRFTYQGREENASWRIDALKRIEEIRTAPLLIQIKDAAGKPVKGASVTATLIQSDFIWGTAANEAMLANDHNDSKNYKQIIKELFNTAVIENGFKAARWTGAPERKQETVKAFEWLTQNGLRQRGHNLVWPGWKFNPKQFKETALKDTAAFRKMIEEDMRSKIAVTKGKLIAWDVINELVHERDFLPYLPTGMPEQWFKLAKELDPTAQLFINEYSMLNSIASPANIKNYLDTIKRLRNSGAPIDAIGVQGHVGRQPRQPCSGN
jgi:GH35 family endo-1,4-beta-xylanase